MRRAIVDREMLDYRRYSVFLKDRSAKIVGAVQKKLGFSDADFAQPT
jgi:hypothetical protein